MKRDELTGLKLTELRTLAKEQSIPKYSSLKKDELISLLAEPEAAEEPKKPKRTVKKKAEKPAEPTVPAEEVKAEAAVVETAAPIEEKPKKAKRTVKKKAAEKPAEPIAETAQEAPAETVEAPAETAPEETAAPEEKAEEPKVETRTFKAKKHKAEESSEEETKAEAEPEEKKEPVYEENTRGVLEIMGAGYGFLHFDDEDGKDHPVYVSQSLIRRFHLHKGDLVGGVRREKKGRENYDPLMRVMSINGQDLAELRAKAAKPAEKSEASEPETAGERSPAPVETAAAAEEVKEPVYEENAIGILDIMDDGFGFLRSGPIMGSDDDIYVSPSLIRRFRLRTGDRVSGNKREKKADERYDALTRVMHINGQDPLSSYGRPQFEKLTPIFPKDRIVLERVGESLTMRVMDLLCPIGKGQRGLIVSPPKAGKTTILKDLAVSVLRSDPNIHLIILLIDERPEEVTDIQETITGDNVEILYSTFDELPEKHRKTAEYTLEHAKRMVESGVDVVILLDSITRLARACNLTEDSSGRTLSGGLDPSALYMPKRFFGAARNTREKGSLTILATALVETGSKMDDIIYEEFKGTGNMELVLSRKLQERRVFPAIDIARTGTRREDLLVTPREIEAENIIRRLQNVSLRDDVMERLLDALVHNRTNAELIEKILKERSL